MCGRVFISMSGWALWRLMCLGYGFFVVVMGGVPQLRPLSLAWTASRVWISSHVTICPVARADGSMLWIRHEAQAERPRSCASMTLRTAQQQVQVELRKAQPITKADRVCTRRGVVMGTVPRVMCVRSLPRHSSWGHSMST